MTRRIIALAVFCIFAVASKSARAASAEDCLSCHGEPSKAGEQGISHIVNMEIFRTSIHGNMECTDCHLDLRDTEVFPHDTPLATVDCSKCHDDEFEDYKTSSHGEGFLAGDPTVPVCSTCHGIHDIRRPSDPKSSVFPSNLVEICIGCHTDRQIVADHDLPLPEEIRAYESSVHMNLLRDKGLSVAATCHNCHGSHIIKPPDDPDSTANRLNIPKTCAKCHQGIYQTYLTSVHGQDYLKGNEDVPVCTDCHGEHSIKSPANPESTVYATHISEICSGCHENEILTKRYGFTPRRVKTYLGTYHGIESSLGNTKVANCASCHGVHDILPANDPKSSVHPNNISNTCGKCHPQAGKDFAFDKIHAKGAYKKSLATLLVEKLYAIFIGVSVAGFLLFVAVDFYARRKKARRIQ